MMRDLEESIASLKRNRRANPPSLRDVGARSIEWRIYVVEEAVLKIARLLRDQK